MALTDNLVSYWAMDEASGTRVDSHGSNDLTDVNTVGSATGKISTAADFESSSSERFDHSDNTDLSLGDVDCVFSAWVKLESKTGSNMAIVDKTTTGDGEFFLYYRNDVDRFRFDVFGGSSFGSGTSIAADALGSPSTGTWYFVVAWHDSAANTINIQVNNGTVDSSSHSAGIYNGSGDWCVGGDSSFGQYFDGLIDEVGFWKGRCLDSTERAQLYNSGSGLAYPFSGAGTFTAAAACTVGAATASGSATFAPGTKTATAAITVGAATAAGNATFTSPVYTGSAAVSSAPATASGSATFSPGTKTATATVSCAPATSSSSATFAAGAKTATATVSCGAATASGTATFAAGTKTATAAVTVGPATASGSATFTAPVYTATAGVSTAPTTASGTAAFNTVVRSANGAVTTGPATAAGAATFTLPTRTATAAVNAGAATASGSASFFTVLFTGSAAVSVAPATASGLATFTATPATPEPYLVDPSKMWEFFVGAEQLMNAGAMQQFFVGFKQSN